MQNPFWGNLQNEAKRMKGASLWIAIGIWVMVLALGLFCALGGLTLPGGESESAEATSEVESGGQSAGPTEGGAFAPAHGRESHELGQEANPCLPVAEAEMLDGFDPPFTV